MKEKDFHYTSLYLYDKTMVSELEQDFCESGIRSKSQYLTHLIGLGLSAKKNGIQGTDMSVMTTDLKEIKSLVSELQNQVLKYQSESEIYKALICYLHYLIECIIYEEIPNFEQTEQGLHDVLPSRLQDRLRRIRKEFNNA